MEEQTDRPMNVDIVDLIRRERLSILKLTDQERKFCERYVTHFDPYVALKEAGYKVPATRKKADGGKDRAMIKAKLDALLAQDYIVEYIKLLKESVLSRIGMSLDNIVDEYRSIAFANIDDYVEWTNAGITKFKSSRQLTRAQKAGILEIVETETKVGRTIRIKLHSKQTALDRLFDILKELEDRDDKPKGAPKISQTQINLVLQDPVKRRAIEHLAEGLFDYKIVLTANDKDRVAFDANLSRMTQNFLEASHEGKNTGKTGQPGQAQITDYPGQERDSQGHGEVDTQAGERAKPAGPVAPKELGAPDAVAEEVGLESEPNRYDIDGL